MNFRPGFFPALWDCKENEIDEAILYNTNPVKVTVSVSKKKHFFTASYQEDKQIILVSSVEENHRTFQLLFFDMSGRVLVENDFRTKTELDICNLSSGTYILHLSAAFHHQTFKIQIEH